MAQVLFYSATREKYDALSPKVATTFYNITEADGKVKLYLGEDLLSTDPTLVSKVSDLETAIATLNGEDTVEGSVSKKIKTAIDALSAVAKSGKAVDVAIEDADGKITAETVEAALLEIVNKVDTNTTAIATLNGDGEGSVNAKVKVVSDKIGDLTALTTEDKNTLVAAINEVQNEVAVVSGAATVSVAAKEVPNNGYLKTYVVSQGTKSVGEIDIPKDLVVTAGTVITVDAEHPEGELANGTYLKLSIANQDTPVYIDVAKMCDVYTAEGSAVQVQVAISADNVISASIVASSISSTELADNAVVTAKIADEAVTEDKLSAELKNWKSGVDTAMTWQILE